MKKGKICSKLKKILITITCVITLVFSMPVKSKAGIIGDFLNLLLQIPDSIMWLGNIYIAGTHENAGIDLNLKGWDGKGSIYNFNITPYDIFTSGSEVIINSNQANKNEQIENLVNSKLGGASYSAHYEEYKGDENATYKVYEYDLIISDIDPDFQSTIDNAGAVLAEFTEERESSGGYPTYMWSSSLGGYGYNYASHKLAKMEVIRETNAKVSPNTTKIKLGLFDVNFFRNHEVEDENGQIVSSNILSAAVGNVYKNLRNLCIVLMMLVLLYIGIRIIISTAASDQSKYKKMLVDWLVGLCLLFVMHYIMSFFMNMNTIILNMLNNDEGDSYYVAIAELGDDGNGKDSTWLDVAIGNNPNGYVTDAEKFFESKVIIESHDNETDTFNVGDDGFIDLKSSDCIMFRDIKKESIDFSHWGNDGKLYLSASIVNSTNDNDKYAAKAIYKANLMEFTRTLSSFALKEEGNIIVYSNGKSHNTAIPESSSMTSKWMALGYGVMYLALVIETVMFCIIYIKRVLQLSMLTMIAPLVSFMYPIDKVGDGQAQAYNGWLKDYMFNVLIQPLHLLLYTIFVSAASQLFQKNIIYALAIYAFMISAEKYFKKIFGFDKASGSPVGAFGGAFGGGLALRGFDKLTGLGPHGKGKGGSSGDKDRKAIKIKKDKPLPSSGSDSSLLGSSGVLGAASRLGTKGSSKAPGSSGGSGGLGGAGSSSGAGGSRVPGSSGGADGSISTGGNSSSAAGPGKKGGLVRNLAKAGRGMVGRSFTRAITGGKYDSLKGLSGTAKFSAIGGAMAKKGANIAGRTVGTLALGSAGLLTGAATAIATGDANNLSKGLSTGVVAGFNRGGQFADWGSDKVGGIISDTSAELANVDEGYRAKYRADQAIAKLDPEDRTDERIAMIEKYARFTDIDGKDAVDALIEADRANYGDEYNTISTYDDAKDYGDLRTESNREAYIRRELPNMAKNFDASDAEIAQEKASQLRQLAARKQKFEEQLAEAIKKNQETRIEKLNEQIADLGVDEGKLKSGERDSELKDTVINNKARAQLESEIDNKLIAVQRQLKK